MKMFQIKYKIKMRVKNFGISIYKTDAICNVRELYNVLSLRMRSFFHFCNVHQKQVCMSASIKEAALFIYIRVFIFDISN